ncbi:hypothetical protein IMG5_120000 [Ichthyophthirius multifiliis]|uniref:Bardet-Biedl syndrome 1 N-terminal domain-containing protein n=1 Tax=Ichthyophthirius multifiliis TaxID=5932 RepID=G0QUX9_ICHMU|nr:hypothetical protein IMG5_120000 [Ichthyophthirius multifiliis]EGR30984.1 hypothetical protein IMG5_120000 [Ichthyophthirius multifiliis]|eukprot:XP_004034470.1 hypothetical protein IMG5_120000 [Ichthyophthirius multifiliis]
MGRHIECKKKNLKFQDKQSPWLIGYRDPVSQINVLQSCIALTQLTGDGESRLIIADQDNRLLSYKGINIDQKLSLQDTPIALAYYYPEQQQLPQPILALAANNHVYFHQNMQRIFRFTLPNIEMSQKEKEIWQLFDGKKEAITKMIEKWNQLKEQQQQDLTYLTLEVLYQSKPQKQYELILQQKFENSQYSIPDTTTCLGTLYNSLISEFSAQNLIIGTENKMLYIMETNGMKIQTQLQLTDVPISIITIGTYQAVQTVLLGNDIYVATMNEVLQCYNNKGLKQFSLKTNSDIVCIEPLVFGQSKQTQGILVGLDNAELRLYIQKQLIHILKLDGIISAMKFGPFGREEGMLVMILKNKGLDIQDEIPLSVPKKTKLFIENTLRHRENYTQIHKSFQKDIMKMRLKTAQTYLSLLEESNNNNLIKNGEINIRIQANIKGLGPLPFIIQCIKKSNYISIDFEFTGLYRHYDLIYNKYDTIQQRYFATKENIKDFQPIQLGLCCFQIHNNEKIEAFPFNIYISQYELMENNDNNIMCIIYQP